MQKHFLFILSIYINITLCYGSTGCLDSFNDLASRDGSTGSSLFFLLPPLQGCGTGIGAGNALDLDGDGTADGDIVTGQYTPFGLDLDGDGIYNVNLVELGPCQAGLDQNGDLLADYYFYATDAGITMHRAINNAPAVFMDQDGNGFKESVDHDSNGLANTYLPSNRMLLGGNVMRKLDLVGDVSTELPPGSTGREPMQITYDGSDLYITTFVASFPRIHKVVPSTSTISTIAGGSNYGYQDGIGANARFQASLGITPVNDELFIAEHNAHTIRKLELKTNSVTTIAGSYNNRGYLDAQGLTARFWGPWSLTNDGINLYSCEQYNNIIRRIDIKNMQVNTLAGDASNKGYNDATGTDARFSYPTGITTDGTFIYISDTENHLIRKIEIETGLVTTLAGGYLIQGATDGVGPDARFRTPTGLSTDGSYLYVIDAASYTIRKISLKSTEVTTLAGSPGLSGDSDGIGSNARFRFVYNGWGSGSTLTGNGMYVVDRSATTVRLIK